MRKSVPKKAMNAGDGENWSCSRCASFAALIGVAVAFDVDEEDEDEDELGLEGLCGEVSLVVGNEVVVVGEIIPL